MGAALGTHTIEALRSSVREAIGPPAEVLEHTCDVIVDEILRQWPERAMADIARRMGTNKAGGEALGAVAVIAARVREQIEARWGCRASDQAALGLILFAAVVEVANLWFASVEHRIGIRRLAFQLRQRAA